jgi:CheY-like chemotaxis protein
MWKSGRPKADILNPEPAFKLPCYTSLRHILGKLASVFCVEIMKSVLFVDDHKPLARLTCEILQMHGYRAECAYDATEALAKFGQGKFDIVVTDYRMEGISGVDLARQLRQQHPEVPIVIVTGCADLEPCAEVSAWVSKQEMFPNLLDTIHQLLNQNTPEETSNHA